jgi:DNA-binding NtrC family response regulator
VHSAAKKKKGKYMVHILVVDDNVEALRLIERGLKIAGHMAIKASSGEEALMHLQRCEPKIELMLTDYTMPKMNGLELLKKVKEMRPLLPVIIMTAYSEKRMVIEAIRSNCNGFIEKPFAYEELMTEIARVFC